MPMVWYNPELAKAEIRISKFGLSLSKGAYKYLNSNNVAIGIDKVNKSIAIKTSDEKGYDVSTNGQFFRVYCKNLIYYLESNGVQLKKYKCEWNNKEKCLIAKY